jgi:hypothetical protein
MIREARAGSANDAISEGEGYSSMEIAEPKAQEEEVVEEEAEAEVAEEKPKSEEADEKK